MNKIYVFFIFFTICSILDQTYCDDSNSKKEAVKKLSTPNDGKEKPPLPSLKNRQVTILNNDGSYDGTTGKRGNVNSYNNKQNNGQAGTQRPINFGVNNNNKNNNYNNNYNNNINNERKKNAEPIPKLNQPLKPKIDVSDTSEKIKEYFYTNSKAGDSQMVSNVPAKVENVKNNNNIKTDVKDTADSFGNVVTMFRKYNIYDQIPELFRRLNNYHNAFYYNNNQANSQQKQNEVKINNNVKNNKIYNNIINDTVKNSDDHKKVLYISAIRFNAHPLSVVSNINSEVNSFANLPNILNSNVIIPIKNENNVPTDTEGDTNNNNNSGDDYDNDADDRNVNNNDDDNINDDNDFYNDDSVYNNNDESNMRTENYLIKDQSVKKFKKDINELLELSKAIQFLKKMKNSKKYRNARNLLKYRNMSNRVNRGLKYLFDFKKNYKRYIDMIDDNDNNEAFENTPITSQKSNAKNFNINDEFKKIIQYFLKMQKYSVLGGEFFDETPEINGDISIKPDNKYVNIDFYPDQSSKLEYNNANEMRNYLENIFRNIPILKELNDLSDETNDKINSGTNRYVNNFYENNEQVNNDGIMKTMRQAIKFVERFFQILKSKVNGGVDETPEKKDITFDQSNVYQRKNYNPLLKEENSITLSDENDSNGSNEKTDFYSQKMNNLGFNLKNKQYSPLKERGKMLNQYFGNIPYPNPMMRYFYNQNKVVDQTRNVEKNNGNYCQCQKNDQKLTNNAEEITNESMKNNFNKNNGAIDKLKNGVLYRQKNGYQFIPFEQKKEMVYENISKPKNKPLFIEGQSQESPLVSNMPTMGLIFKIHHFHPIKLTKMNETKMI